MRKWDGGDATSDEPRPESVTWPITDEWLAIIGVATPGVLLGCLLVLRHLNPWGLEKLLLLAFGPVIAAMAVAGMRADGARCRWSSAALFCAWMFALSAGLFWLYSAIIASI